MGIVVVAIGSVLGRQRPRDDEDLQACQLHSRGNLTTDYEALLVKRNAPRWLRTLRRFDILVSNDDGTVSVRWPERTVPMH